MKQTFLTRNPMIAFSYHFLVLWNGAHEKSRLQQSDTMNEYCHQSYQVFEQKAVQVVLNLYETAGEELAVLRSQMTN